MAQQKPIMPFQAGMPPGRPGMVAPQGAAALTEQQALARFQAMDKDHDHKLSYEEWRALEASRGGMYDGPRFEGEARVPLEDEIHKLERRILHKNKCLRLIAYVCFLAVYVAINLCYPRTNRGELVSGSRAWIERQTWGDGQSVNDISSEDDFWSWFNEVIVASFWNEEGTVLAFNKVVSGVTLAQRRKNFTSTCETAEAKVFADCPRWPQMDAFLSGGVDSTLSAMLEGTTPYVQGDRTNFVFEPLPVMQVSTTGSRSYVSRSAILNRTRELRTENWVNASTAETIVLVSLYNPNTRLYSSIQIRFLLQQTGALEHDVIVWAGVFDTLSESVRLAGGAPWQFRVTLEILFVLAVTIKAIREAIEVFLCVKAAIHRRSVGAKSGSDRGGCAGALAGLWEGLTDYATSFWNLVDIFGLVLAALVIALQIKTYILRNEVMNYFASLDSASGELPDQVTLAAYLIKIANLDALFDICNTMCLLVAFFRLFRCLEFHGRLGIVSRTIGRAWTTLFHFGTVLFLVVCGYVIVGWIMFANKSDYFRTPVAAFGSVVVLMTVGIDYEEFLNLVDTDQLTWWAFLPISMYYFGFMFIAAILLLNVLLGIVLGAYEEVQRGAEAAVLDDTIAADVRAAWFQLKKSLGCVKGKPRTSKVDPMCAFLTPADAERVRPSLEATYNELVTVHEVLSLPREGCIVPFRKLEAAPLVATFNYADLSQLFTDPVAMYLWALYGPGAPPEEPNVVPRDSAAEDLAARENAKLEEVAHNQRRLEAQVADLQAKLVLVLAALVDDPAESRVLERPAAGPPMMLSPRPEGLAAGREDVPASPRIGSEILTAQVPMLASPAGASPGAGFETKLADAAAQAASGNAAATAVRARKPGDGATGDDGDSDESSSVVSSSSSSSSSSSESTKSASKGPGDVGEAAAKEAPGQTPSTGAPQPESARQQEEAPETKHDEIADAGLQAQSESGAAQVPENSSKDEYLSSEDGPDEHELEAAFEQLMDDLLADTGKCPMKMVANACKAHKPEIPWKLAKSLRRDLGIVQRTDEVWTDHGSRKQIIRVWKRATTAEEFDILERWRQEHAQEAEQDQIVAEGASVKTSKKKKKKSAEA